MRIYEHTQAGTRMLWVLGCATAVAGFIAFERLDGRPTVAVVAVVLLLSMVLFSSLTVVVTNSEVSLAFGVGLVRRKFDVAQIADVRAVRNPWYYGWGIHLTPRGWLYNIGGADAVEIDLEGGRRVRIGTDEPERLLMAIRQTISHGKT